MATATAYYSVNMDTAQTWYGDVTIANANQIQIARSGYVQNYYGNFTYNSYGLSGGTVTSTDYYEYGNRIYTISGGSYSALTIESYIDWGNMNGLFSYVFSGNDTFNGSSQSDTLNGFYGSDTLYGNGGNDSLSGSSGDDTLNGGIGSDILIGGSGNDIYVVDSETDYLFEYYGEGIDTVQSTVSLTLAANVENLTLTGTGSISGIGNALANTITGNSGNNRIEGIDGNDTLTGGAGSDTFVISPYDYGTVRITDYGPGDRIEISGFHSSGSLVAGNGTNVGSGETQLSAAGGVTTLYFGLNGTPGYDARLTLTGTYAISAFGRVGDAFVYNRAPTGSLTIGGMARQGQILSVGSTLTDPDGTGILAYQWQVSTNGTDWADYGWETQLTLDESLVGQRIRVRASYTDGLGIAETVTSAATAPVANVNDVAEGEVTIAGSLEEGFTLTASNSLSDRDGLGTVAYQWQTSSNGTTWSNLSAGEALLLTSAQLGQRIRVTASYTDAHGTREAVTSAATETVIPHMNRIAGTSGADTLVGTAITDIMTGGSGDDSYRIDSMKDQVVEAANGGADSVQANIRQGGFKRLLSVFARGLRPRLDTPDHVENFTLEGNTLASLTGNALNNTLTGNSQNNTLNGGDGDDTLIGGGGRDVFIGGAGSDTFVIDWVGRMAAAIRDYAQGTDHIGLGRSSYGQLFTNGTLDASMLGNGTSATSETMRLYYDSSRAALFFDADGSGAMAPSQIASFTANRPASLSTTDFVLAG